MERSVAFLIGSIAIFGTLSPRAGRRCTQSFDLSQRGERHPVRRIITQYLFELLDGFFSSLPLIEEDRKIQARGDEVRRKSDGLAVRGDRLAITVHLVERHAEVIKRLRVEGVHLDGALILADTVLDPAHTHVQRAEIDEGGREFRRDLESGAVLRFRRLVETRLPREDAHAEVRVLVTGVEREGSLVGIGRLLRCAGFTVDSSEVAQNLRPRGIHTARYAMKAVAFARREGFLVGLHGLLRFPLLAVHIAEVIESHVCVRIERERMSEERRRVMPDERLLHRQTREEDGHGHRTDRGPFGPRLRMLTRAREEHRNHQENTDRRNVRVAVGSEVEEIPLCEIEQGGGDRHEEEGETEGYLRPLPPRDQHRSDKEDADDKGDEDVHPRKRRRSLEWIEDGETRGNEYFLQVKDGAHRCHEDFFRGGRGAQDTGLADPGDDAESGGECDVRKFLNNHPYTPFAALKDVDQEEENGEGEHRHLREQRKEEGDEAPVITPALPASTVREVRDDREQEEEGREHVLARARPNDRLGMERMDGEEDPANDCDPLAPREEETEPCNEERVARVPQEVLQVVDPGMDASDEVVDLVAEEGERDVELRIVGGENLLQSGEVDRPDEGVLVDEHSVIPADEMPAE